MNYVEKIIIGDFKTGINKIDVEFVVTYWNYLYFITEWENTWRFVKMKRVDGRVADVKTAISSKQANELIERLELICEKGLSIYRRKIDWNYVNKYNEKKKDKKSKNIIKKVS